MGVMTIIYSYIFIKNYDFSYAYVYLVEQSSGGFEGNHLFQILRV